MNLKKLGFILLIGIVLFLFLCRSPAINNWDINKGDGKPNKIIFFGDSLTTGYGLKDKADSFPHQIARQLKFFLNHWKKFVVKFAGKLRVKPGHTEIRFR